MTNLERCQYIRFIRRLLAHYNQVQYTIMNCDHNCKKMCPILVFEGDDLELRLRAKNDEGYNINFGDIDSVKDIYCNGGIQDKKDPEVRRWLKFTKSIKNHTEKRTTMGVMLDSFRQRDGDTAKIESIIEEYMNHGKELCKRLKAIRKAVADANGIEYNLTECHHKGRCPGTCPVCDAEVEEINKALKRKIAMGEEIVIPEFDIEDLCLSGVDTNPMNPFAGEARTPDDIKRIHEEYDIPYDEDEDECEKEQGDIASEPFTLMGELITPIEEILQGNLEIPEVFGGIITPPNDDEDEETEK